MVLIILEKFVQLLFFCKNVKFFRAWDAYLHRSLAVGDISDILQIQFLVQKVNSIFYLNVLEILQNKVPHH